MRKKIIKTMSLIAVFILLFTLCACGNTSGSDTTADTENSENSRPPLNVGVLTMLNLSEEETSDLVTAHIMANRTLRRDYIESTRGEDATRPTRAEGEERPTNADGTPVRRGPEINVTFFDTLDSMLMALNAGDISTMSVYLSTANYLCATNDNLVINNYSADKIVDNEYSRLVTNGILSNDFSFLMLESNSALRDEFNTAIQGMKEDGTLQTLISEQIDAYKNGNEIKAVALPQIAGAETVKVAVTGSLPPMDYVAADGSPAGFNTAVLAEISNRIGKNIEIVVVDSIGRAAALSSGTVDVVFWTRTSEVANNATPITDAEIEELKQSGNTTMNEREINTLNRISSLIDFNNYGKLDMPEGTIVTDSYFSDRIVSVTTKENKEKQDAERESRRAERESERAAQQTETSN
ncbi:MAG: transporter substrate-binding domain-containing protein [Lachnospiraceae bacterium]|nr:transporter substrate-binding domain-containing protein [Lachnospiraceae bacterium]